MSNSPRLGAPELVSGQAIPETKVNEQLRYAEQGAGAFIGKDKDLTAPPGSPAEGDCYIVAATATGAWVGKEGQLAFYLGGAWAFVTPIEGTRAYLQDENGDYRFDGAAWVSLGSGISYTDAMARAAVGYSIAPFFTSTPSASEVLCLHVAAEAFTIPANFATPTSVGNCATNPTASFAIDVQRNGVSIGTITISTGGVFTFATTSGTAKAFAVGDVLKLVAPATPDATCANVAITIRGSR